MTFVFLQKVLSADQARIDNLCQKLNYIFTGCLASALVGEGHLPNSSCAKILR